MLKKGKILAEFGYSWSRTPPQILKIPLKIFGRGGLPPLNFDPSANTELRYHVLSSTHHQADWFPGGAGSVIGVGLVTSQVVELELNFFGIFLITEL